MNLGGLGRWFVLMLNHRAILATAYAVWVVLEVLGCWWMVILNCRAIWPL